MRLKTYLTRASGDGPPPLTCLLLLIFGLLLPSVALADITGTVTVVDGDMLEIRGTRIRLHGIDAPESGQLCQRSGKYYRCDQQAAPLRWMI